MDNEQADTVKINKFQSITIRLFASLIFVILLLGNAPTGFAQSSQNWSEPINLSNSGSTINPLPVVDTNGVFHILWMDKIDKGYKYVKSQDGITWSSPLSIKFPFTIDDPLPMLVAGPNGVIHVFWRDARDALYYFQILSGGFVDPAKWGKNIKLAESAANLDVAVDAQGIVHISYVRNISSEINPSGIYYRRLDGSGGWSEPVKLYLTQYFRALKSDDVNVHIVTSKDAGDRNLYVVWDNRLQKRIFMAKSIDGGNSWLPPVQIRGPEDATNYDASFNINVSVMGSNVLLVWQVGEPGAPRCATYSQWSADGGDHWDEVIKVFDGNAICPTSNNFILEENGFSTALLSSQGSLSLIAWNGKQWSGPQPQSDLFDFSNPATHDAVLLDCEQEVLYRDKLFVVGCEKSVSGDIWLRSRTLGSVADWFVPQSAWSSPKTLTNTTQKISSLTSVTDGNIVHTIWVQSPLTATDENQTVIQYAQWNGAKWSNPQTIMWQFNGLPVQLFSAIDGQGRILLTWVDGGTGDLLFSWAKAERANISSEWAQPKILPSPSQVNSSPDVIVDASGRIIVAYAVPINEKRGIYITESTDFGENWSLPKQVFDAESNGWDMIDAPKMSLGGDGRLHVLFTRYSMRGDNHADGLSYTQSITGGDAWSEPVPVGEGSVQWSEAASYGQGVAHRLWQEKDKLVVAILDQVSQDGGETWSSPINVTGVSEKVAQVSMTGDSLGHLHFVQLAREENLTLQDWEWNDTTWNLRESAELSDKGKGAQYVLADSVVSQDSLTVFVTVNYPEMTGDLKNELLSFSRFLGSPTDALQTPVPPVLSTPNPATNSTEVPTIQPAIPTEIPQNPPSTKIKNIVGLVLVFVIPLLLILIFYGMRRGRKRKK